MTLQKRTQMLEEQYKSLKDTSDKRHENVKELVKGSTAMLEHRLEIFEGLEEKFNILNMDNNKAKHVHEDYRKKMIEEVSKLKLDQSSTKTELQRHMQEY